MKVAVVQHDILWLDLAANLGRLDAMIDSAAAGGASLIVLPERFATGAVASTTGAAEEEAQVTQFLTDAAQRVGASICGAVTAEGSDGRSTTVLLVESNGTVHRNVFATAPAPGVGSIEKFPAGIPIGDLRVTAVAGSMLSHPLPFLESAPDTDVFVVCANKSEGVGHQWQTLLSARAIESRCYVVGANRVGAAGNTKYVGHSQVVDPQGAVLTAAWGAETILFAELESALVRFMRDRNGQRESVIRI